MIKDEQIVVKLSGKTVYAALKNYLKDNQHTLVSKILADAESIIKPIIIRELGSNSNLCGHISKDGEIRKILRKEAKNVIREELHQKKLDFALSKVLDEDNIRKIVRQEIKKCIKV